ncbi:MAG TPA: hypothetical protein VL500_03505 [Candidatus Eisenbacteria bacterium]|jgi:hypothetical protein|nr:hypothetical protein [Candidatus Eisenbacteria bacterium]
MADNVPSSFELGRMFFHHARKAKGLTRYGVLSELFRKAWSIDTASPGCQASWTPGNPAFGQCAVTALCLQDMCGGTIVRCTVEGFGSHYFNHLPNGEGYSVYDLTRTQFPSGTVVPQGAPVERPYILESPRAIEFRTPQRYDLLKQALAAAIRAAG